MNRTDIEQRLAKAPMDGVVSVYLFGSVAEGRSHAESDVDLGVLLDWNRFADSAMRFEKRVSLSSELATTAVAFDVVILNDAPPQLASRIVTEGFRIFCSDSEADHNFRRDAQLKAADLEPFLRRMRRIKLEALAKQ
ncbi:MAG TPA: nucleotidyltransferase domain-containing protein [Thermoanaerobaculia bacterium]